MSACRPNHRSLPRSLTPSVSPMHDDGKSTCSAGGSGKKTSAPPSRPGKRRSLAELPFSAALPLPPQLVPQTAGPGIVRLRRSALVELFTCPLCSKLVQEATAISICLHTFCRKCIFEKLNDEEEDSICPVCDVYLGNNPLEKLRPDHNLQIISKAAFPLKKRSKVHIPSPVVDSEQIATPVPDQTNS